MHKKLNNLKTSVSGYRVYDAGNGASILCYDCKIGGRVYHNTILRMTKQFDNCLKAKILQFCKQKEK